MTLKELIDCTLEGEPYNDDTALQCFFSIAGAMRSALQGEPSTFEGECSAVMALKNRGYPPTIAGLEKLMKDCPNLLEIDIPDSVLLKMSEAARRDDIEEDPHA